MSRRFVFAFCLAAVLPAVAEEPYSPFADPSFPFASLSVDASPEGEPRTNWVPRGVVVRVPSYYSPPGEQIWALYDVDLVRLAAVWRGPFPEGATIAQLSYQNTKKKASGGQKGVPRVSGEILFSTPMLPGMWKGEEAPTEDPRDQGPDDKELGRGPVDFESFARWRGVEVDAAGNAVVVYEVAGGTVRERFGARLLSDESAFRRNFTFSGLTEKVAISNGEGRPPIVLGPGTGEPFKSIPRGGRRWGNQYVVEGVVSERERDAIPLPLDNSFGRPVRPSAIAFYDDGRAAITTVDGDVWMVSGLDNELDDVLWSRFAAGLHEPYSAVVREGELFVFDRGGLKRLHDRDGDGEADYHEWFCHDFWQSAETRDFPHDMALRPDGGFYLVKGGQQNDHLSKHSGRVLSVSPDGSCVEVFSSGHRNAYLGLRDETGELFACDQQGHWVPTTPVQLLRKGGYYGFQRAAPHGVPEPPVEPALGWIPHRIAQSAVDVIPLADGTLAVVDYFRPGLLKVYPNGASVRAGGRGTSRY